MKFYTCLLLGLIGSRAGSQVVLTELMYNPAGPEAHDEYVELFNRSQEMGVDLRGWSLGDADEQDLLEDTGMGTVLSPGQLALVLDGSYFGQSTTYDTLPEEVLVLRIADRAFGKRGWSNSEDEAVILRNADGTIQDSMRYHPVDRPGHSLEKLHLRSDDSDSWEASDGGWQLSPFHGGSPGLPNSLGQVQGSIPVEMQIAPNPFARSLSVEYRIPQAPAWARLWIYNMEGDKIRTLLDGDEVGAKGRVEWNGRDRHGRLVKEGLYIAYMEVSAQGKTTRLKQVVVRQSEWHR
ncbi:MAG: hypothetical protein GKR89_22995 [Candidatus Latescibacteria bacterium]|nr:hypothetical protein [Candidatus Latescibacterota bacterium]